MKLTEIEEKVINARLEGTSFYLLDKDGKRYACDQILLKGAAISGCPLPHTDFFAEIISEQVSEFICQFGYAEFTLKEIILAMQMNAKGGLRFPTGTEVEQVPFTGSCFNVDYLAKILSNYLTVRNILDQKFKNFIDGY